MKVQESIAVIDFGSQYAHLIANRIRRLGVFAEILLPDAPLESFKNYKGVILSGGPQSVYDKHSPRISKKIFELGVPILGLCYGHQLIAQMLGGKVEPGTTKEYGLAHLKVRKKKGILKEVSEKTQVWMSHGDTVTKVPKGFEVLGSTDDCAIAVMGSMKQKIFSAQFHLEVTHTREGMKMLDSFLKVCKVRRQWNIKRFLDQKVKEVKEKLNGRNVFLLASGGVDSTVAYAFLAKAVGPEKVYGLLVDTGFLRKGEAEGIRNSFKKMKIKNFEVFDARKMFFDALKGVTDPEEKRAIIGKKFLEAQAAAVQKMGLDTEHWVLGQGTIYPDTIESAGTKHSDKIKTHHNRVPEIEALIAQNKVIEPLADLYKDEVRMLGEKLGLPKDMIWKHPFPGPGLAVRTLCVKKADPIKDQKLVEKRINEFLKKYGLNGVILPIKSVGVQGDNRTYRHPLVVWGKVTPFASLEKISTALTNRFPEINRVCLLVSGNEMSQVKAIKSDLSPLRIKLLQELDDRVMKFVKVNKLERKIWQFPTVLLPIACSGSKKESVVLRPVCSEEAMTANFYKMSTAHLSKLTKSLAPYVSSVLYDITNKPPGTIEWE